MAGLFRITPWTRSPQSPGWRIAEDEHQLSRRQAPHAFAFE